MSTATETTATPTLNSRKFNEATGRIQGILSQGKPRIRGKFAYEAYFAERLSDTDLAQLRRFYRHELTTLQELIELSRALRPIERELHEAQKERDERKQAEYEARQAAKAANRKPPTRTAPDIAQTGKSFVTIGTANPQGPPANRTPRGGAVADAGKGNVEKKRKTKK